MVDEKYVKDFDKWIENEKIKISLLENEIRYLERDIELSQKQLEIAKERIPFIEMTIEGALKTHNQYLEDNKE